MHYSHKLQNEIIERDRVLVERLERTQEFINHLNLPKFDKELPDGSRGDWISKQDVLNWLNYIQNGN